MERLVKVFRHSALPVFPSIVIMDPSTPDKRLVQRIQTMHDVWLLQVRAGKRGWRGTVAHPPLRSTSVHCLHVGVQLCV
jgi:hypothetical protein